MAGAPASALRRSAAVLRRFGDEQRGAAAIEYALLAVGIGVVIAATVFLVGEAVEGAFVSLLDALRDALGA